MPGRRDSAPELSTVARPRAFAPATAAFAITVTGGFDAGRSLVVDASLPSRTLVGQSPACALRLADPMVSRRHAAFEMQGSDLRITDLDSTNGTFVNGLRVLDAYLRGGEQVTMGDTSLSIARASPPRAEEISNATSFGHLLGASFEMRRLYPVCERLAASSVPLVIEGETGTGKEVLAEAIHEASPRASGPFVVFDCTAVPPSLVEAELFGHERGAFTGAVATRKGLFEQAHQGTLLIDEIGDLDLSMQPKLLRAIERSAVRRVGANAWIAVDVRIIAATRRDLDREVQMGRFRDDLFFRLAVARIELPPLRRRSADIALLTRHFWTTLGARGEPPDDLLQLFESYPWPGNVRELYNAVARRIALGHSDGGPSATRARASPASPGDDVIAGVLALGLPLAQGRQRVVDEYERRFVEHVLAQHGGNVRRAAKAAGIARRYFQVLRARQNK